jgi:hypothetical protein
MYMCYVPVRGEGFPINAPTHVPTEISTPQMRKGGAGQ